MKASFKKTYKRKTLTFPPIHEIVKSHLTTEEAAYYLNRAPQTLRAWSCLGNSPITPNKMHGRLLWSVSDIKATLGITG